MQVKEEKTTCKTEKGNNFFLIIIIGFVLGGISFLLIYGTATLNVQYDGWLLEARGDLAAHYQGWKFYRASEWHFPPGLVDGVIYPNKISLMSLDCIPLFAIFFKILSPILPQNFQYIGLFGLFSFVMQGVISSLILYRFNKNILFISFGTLILIITPMVLCRMFAHTALGAQWLILSAFCIWAYKDFIPTLKQNCLIWGILFFLCTTINGYFVLMCFMVLLGYLIENLIKTKNLKFSFTVLLTSVLSVFFSAYLIGAFHSAGTIMNGLELFSANLNTLFNPLTGFPFTGSSIWFKKLPLVTDHQWEGSAYLGSGLILMLFVTLPYSIYQYLTNKKTRNNSLLAAAVTVLLVSFIFALSPRVTFYEHVLFTIPYPKFVISALSIFRTSGRMIWVAWYLIAIFALKTAGSFKRNIILVPIVAICSFIQIYEMKNIIIIKHKYFANYTVYKNPLTSENWNDIRSEYKHFVFEVYESDYLFNKVFDIANFAIDNNITLSNYYYSMPVSEKINKEFENHVKKPNCNTLYFFNNEESAKKLIKGLYIYKIDGLTVGTIRNHNNWIK